MATASARPLLLGARGCGNAIVECAFALAGLPLDREEVDYAPGSPTRARLLAVNPLGQVPALVLGDGRVLTESLAMLHYVNDRAPQAGLVPPPGDPGREAFHRWSAFLVAAVYPTFTYGDDPGRWVADERAAAMLRERTDRHRESLLRHLEAAAGEPWFLGRGPCGIDLYLAAMVHWRPGHAWFAAHAPRLAAIAERARVHAVLGPVLAAHFS